MMSDAHESYQITQGAGRGPRTIGNFPRSAQERELNLYGRDVEAADDSVYRTGNEPMTARMREHAYCVSLATQQFPTCNITSRLTRTSR